MSESEHSRYLAPPTFLRALWGLLALAWIVSVALLSMAEQGMNYLISRERQILREQMEAALWRFPEKPPTEELSYEWITRLCMTKPDQSGPAPVVDLAVIHRDGRIIASCWRTETLLSGKQGSPPLPGKFWRELLQEERGGGALPFPQEQDIFHPGPNGRITSLLAWKNNYYLAGSLPIRGIYELWSHTLAWFGAFMAFFLGTTTQILIRCHNRNAIQKLEMALFSHQPPLQSHHPLSQPAHLSRPDMSSAWYSRMETEIRFFRHELGQPLHGLLLLISQIRREKSSTTWADRLEALTHTLKDEITQGSQKLAQLLGEADPKPGGATSFTPQSTENTSQPPSNAGERHATPLPAHRLVVYGPESNERNLLTGWLTEWGYDWSFDRQEKGCSNEEDPVIPIIMGFSDSCLQRLTTSSDVLLASNGLICLPENIHWVPHEGWYRQDLPLNPARLRTQIEGIRSACAAPRQVSKNVPCETMPESGS